MCKSTFLLPAVNFVITYDTKNKKENYLEKYEHLTTQEMSYWKKTFKYDFSQIALLWADPRFLTSKMSTRSVGRKNK